MKTKENLSDPWVDGPMLLDPKRLQKRAKENNIFSGAGFEPMTGEYPPLAKGIDKSFI
jgi:hypothetical protein